MKETIKNLKRCSMIFDGCKREAIFIIIFGLLAAVMQTIVPSINGNLINTLLNGKYGVVFLLATTVGILEIARSLFNILSSKNYLELRKKSTLSIQKKIMRAILNFDIDVYSIYGGGSIINKIKSDTKSIITFLNNAKEGVLSLLSSIIILVYVFYLNKVIGLCYLVFVIILFLLQYYGIKKSLQYKEKLLEENDKNTSLLSNIIQGIKDIKTLKLKDKFYEKATSSFDAINTYDYKSTIYIEYLSKISNLIGVFFFGIIVLISIPLIKYGYMSASIFVIIFMYKTTVFSFSSKVSGIVNNLKQFNLSIERVSSILDYEKETFGDKKLEGFKGNVAFKNVSFGYSDNLIFKGFNLEIEPNSLTVITGTNGAGKSTLLSLLTKVLKPSTGSIILDDTDISDLTELNVRHNVSLVTQQPYIFNLSIKENLSMIDANIDHIKEICRMVGLEKKIESLEKGYDTIIRADGTNLSGGEKQKLSIARALLANTKVLLLDEITNNLDAKTIGSIVKLLEKLKKKYTIIMVTHNIEVAMQADRIILLEKGKIVADGTHQKLIRENPKYQKLFNGIKG